MDTQTRTPSSSPSNAARKWQLRTKHLHFFWLLVYPRIVGRIWQYDISEDALRSDFKAYLLNEIDLFIAACDKKETKAILEDIRAVFSRLEIGLLPGSSYDFVLSEEGIDLPFVNKPDREAIFRNYRDRSVTPPQMNLPKIDDDLSALDIDRIPAPAPPPAQFPRRVTQTIGAPIGSNGNGDGTIESFMYDKQRTRHYASGRRWQVQGSLLASLIRATDRIIAEQWYEEIRRTDEATTDDRDQVRDRVRRDFKENARAIIGDYLELTFRGRLLEAFEIQVVLEEEYPDEDAASGYSYLSQKGLTICFPKAPELSEIIEDMALGKAGNPMYSNTHSTNGTW
jgi:hypothetical protein